MNRFVFILSIMIAGAAFATSAPQPTPAPQPLILKDVTKSAAEYQHAYNVSYELTALAFPKLIGDISSAFPPEKRADMEQKLRSRIKDSEFSRCLLKEGMDKFIINHTINSIKPNDIRKNVATLWAKHNPNSLLDKSLDMMKSPTFQKTFTESQRTRQPALAVMKTMMEDGRLQESDVNQIMAQMSDPEVLTFLRESKGYLKLGLEQTITGLKSEPNTAVQEFMSQNAAKAIKCGPATKSGTDAS